MLDWNKPIELVYNGNKTVSVSHHHEYKDRYYIWIGDLTGVFDLVFNKDGKAINVRSKSFLRNKPEVKRVYLFQLDGEYCTSCAKAAEQIHTDNGWTVIGYHDFVVKDNGDVSDK